MTRKLMSLVSTRPGGERGATATEYALLAAFIAIVITAGVFAFGGALNDYYLALAGWVTTVLGP